jgi:outer membrane receptor protein involved in Fe transport
MKTQASNRARRFGRAALSRLPLATAIHFACFAPAFADADPQPPPAPTSDTTATKSSELETITVTAQKRTENAQDVPISMDVISSDKLREMNVSDFQDYVKLLPAVSTQQFSPGFSQVYMRGVASGSNGNHSGPLPSVGQYLDEEPITTIQGALDMHMYDVARVEALAGPQGTLYGASSQSGTIRVITNKPDPSAFSSSISLDANSVDHGGIGWGFEGYVNIPLSENIALRLVGWDLRDAGYIDNVFGTRTYPTSGVTVDNASQVKKNYNVADTSGGRAALKIDLNDSWSITPTVAGQGQHENGIWAYDPNVGNLKVSHEFPESSEDRWVQSALTVQGKVGNFDVVYAFAHLNRSDHTESDYSDYSFWYDVCCGYGAYWVDKNGNVLGDPGQYIHGHDVYRKTSNELRVSSPLDWRFRFVVGAFDERQSHDIQQEYIINGLAPDLSVTGWPNTLWLTKQVRHDDDSALFGEMSFDFTDQLTGTLGARFFHTQNSLKGYYGFAPGYSSSEGEATCFNDIPFEGAPCSDLDKTTKASDHIGRANLTYKITPDAMIYATWSEGFRPGGINRRADLPPYQPDFLTNYEFGWKTEWLDHHLRWNGAVFRENWKDFQFAVLGQNGLTVIKNAAQARIDGFESNLSWAATYNLVLSAGIALYHSELTKNYCGVTDDQGNPITDCTVGDPNFPDIAPKGTRLPITPKVKGNLVARYNFEAFGMESYFQGGAFFQDRRRSDLRLAEDSWLHDLPGYGTVDLSAGTKKDKWSFDFYIKNLFDNGGQLYRYAECAEEKCGLNPDLPKTPEQLALPGQVYVIPVEPRTIGIRVSYDF